MTAPRAPFPLTSRLPPPRPSSPAYLEESGVFLAVVVLFARVLPRDAKDALLLVLPYQARVFRAVNLLDQPLAEFPVAAAHRAHAAAFDAAAAAGAAAF